MNRRSFLALFAALLVAPMDGVAEASPMAGLVPVSDDLLDAAEVPMWQAAWTPINELPKVEIKDSYGKVVELSQETVMSIKVVDPRNVYFETDKDGIKAVLEKEGEPWA